jgi:DNA-binding IscR family transcriptional regulator
MREFNVLCMHTHCLVANAVPTSSRFAVAVHALAFLEISGGKPLRSEDLALSASTNATSQRGAGGGALLARSSKAIRLLDVYLAVEDPELFALHRCEPNKTCPVGRNILKVIRPTLDRAREALEAELAGVTVYDIAKKLHRTGELTVSWSG